MKRLDELIVATVFGHDKLPPHDAQSANTKKDKKQHFKKTFDLVAKLAKKDSKDVSFNQIGVYNFLVEIEKIEAGIKDLMD